ncbi:MAG: CDP-alcohol phosphatidyltransferase family protein [Firmicutes bacterium]|nr:CDP-alcohol phosphatidyltransferase family protein [Bacillota bacterium]
MQQKKLLGYYNYTVILTYIGVLIGFIGIVYAFENHVFRAVICLMIAGFCDMFDGTVATTKIRTEQEKCFGIQIDSFSDLICFGVLPASIVYSLNAGRSLVLTVCLLYLLCALIRLAYFNVDEQERQKNSDAPREVYSGLPVTLSALFLPLVYGATELFSWRPSIAPTAALLVMALLFLLPFPLKKPKLIGKICMVLCGILEIGFVLFACDGV